ncbi:RHS repeat domain-containing protein [Chitinophaga agrisoli]|nr:hypothetical protein [Chitinophaga agrisoli]
MKQFLRKQIGRWITLCLLLVAAGSVHAQTGNNVVFKKVLDGSRGQLVKDSAITVRDTAFFSTTFQNKLDTPYSVMNVITFRINEYSPLYLRAPFTASAKVRIYYITPQHTVDSIDEKILDINYDTTRAYSARNSFVFKNAHEVTVKVLSMTVSIPDLLPALMIENEMQVHPVYKLSCTADAINSIYADNTANTDSTDEIRISWSTVTGADVYDLEWAYIDSSALGRYGTPPNADLLFKNNATRVTISDNAYKVPLLYDNGGVLFFRVRAVQEKPGNRRVETAWSSDFTTGLGRFSFTGHQRNLNWQSDISFAEDGKRKAVVQYLDGGLHSRQTVTKDNTTNTTVVAESFYDYQGRPVVQVMPAPTLNTIIKYSRNFNSAANGAEYDKDQYDHLEDPNEFLTASAAPMSTGSGASQYYSPENPDKDNGSSRFIPDAGGYPFTETSYMQDNTGRISRQGGLGPVFKMGSNHETKYFYGSPGDNDLDALFGTEAGDKTHYFKNMVRDANGQYSVSYVDMHGRTIATALAGMPDSANLDPLPSYSVYNTTANLSGPGKNMVKELVMETRQSQAVTIDADYTFNYHLTPPVLQKKDCDGNTVCYNGLYDLEITITDDSQNQLMPDKKPFKAIVRNYTPGAIEAGNCNDAAPVLDTNFTIRLKKGSYEITKQLTVSTEGMDYYRDNVYMPANLCKTLDDFISQQLALVANIECTPTCQSCLTSIGSLDSFRVHYMNRIDSGGNVADYEKDIEVAYNDAVASCDALCNKLSETDDIRMAMLMDMTPPSGQYADISNVNDSHSIFYSTGNDHPPYYQSGALIYRDETGQPDSAYNELSNSNVLPQQLSPTQFASKFNDTWAETLLSFHPEYCKLVELEKHAASTRWDRKFEIVDTYAEAKALGYLNPTANPAYTSYNLVADNKDSLAQESAELQGLLEGKLTNFQQNYSMWSVAVIAIKCPQSDNACMVKYGNAQAAFDEASLCPGELDMAWRAFRGLYQQAKRDIINAKINAACQVSASDLAGKQLHFNNTQDALNQQQLGYLNNGDATTAAAAATAALQQAYDENCKAYAEYWLQQLAPCAFANTTEWNEVKDKLVQVCKDGSDLDHPYGSSTVKPGGSYDYHSFEEVIGRYNTEHPGKPFGCNAMMITVPKPYDRQPAYADKPSFTKPADCECDKLQQLQKEFVANKRLSDVDLSAYLKRTRNVVISSADINKLINACNSASNCAYTDAPLKIPALMQCNTGPGCATCHVVDSLFTIFTHDYPDVVPSVEESDTTQLQKNQLFAGYMNNRLGFDKQAWEYLKFRDSCQHTSSRDTVVCTPSQLLRTYSTGASATDVFSDIVKTADNGYLLVGSTTGSGNGGKDAYVVKTDRFGNFQWAKTYGGTGNDDFVRMRPTKDNGYIAIGTTTSSYSAGHVSDAFIVKMDVNGEVQWSRAIGFKTTNGEQGMDILPIGDGYAFAGEFNFERVVGDWMVGRLDSLGHTIWTQRIGTQNSDPTLKLLDDDGTLVAAGTSVYGSNYNGVLLKIEMESGQVVFSRQYDLDSRTNWFLNIFKNNNGYKINVLNATDWGNKDGVGAILDLDKQGTILSAKKVAVPAGNEDSWLAINRNSDGSTIAAQVLAKSPQDIVLHRTNQDGDGLAWSNLIQADGVQAIYALTQNEDGTIAGVGGSDNKGLLLLTNAEGKTGCGDVPANNSYQNCIMSELDYEYGEWELIDTIRFISVVAKAANVTPGIINCPGYENCYTFNNGPLLCGNASPVFPAAASDNNNCSDNDFFATSTGSELYYAYRDSVRNAFNQDYLNTALQAANKELFTVNYNNSEYHYTLYYYDQAGNLVKTVPPAGVVVNRTQAWANDVKAASAAGNYLVPAHTMATRYYYNTLNKVIKQETPDAGTSHFWYDRLGRLAVSQNAKQEPMDAYSYTQYDPLGRVVEVGEITSSAGMSDDISRSDDVLSEWFTGAENTKTQITRTAYDKPYTPLEGDEDGHILAAANARNRVSWSAVYDTKVDLDQYKYTAGTFYSYDVLGNVDTLVQDFKRSILQVTNNRWRRMVYNYDLISGKVNQVAYQPGESDAFYHRYSYDAENRMTNVETSHDSIYWENDAFYRYYKHGPLARTILGQQQVQGLDYAYTLQGWLKGVNSTSLTSASDMGGDGTAGNIVAKDAFGFALHYFGGRDYNSIKSGVKPFAEGADAGSNFRPLFNGNIAAMSVHVPFLGEPLLYAYNYDVLNRLTAMNALRNLNTATNTWAPSLLEDFKEKVTYDANGNILSYLRNGNQTFAGKPLGMDSLSYAYISGTNQLDHIEDKIDSTVYDNDIDNQLGGNYGYDPIGNLIQDSKGGIDEIKWTVYGKIQSIHKTNGTTISYTYDGTGNRISKDVNGKQTWYVRDVSGNIMSVYTSGDASVNNGDLTRTEAGLYGSSRLGISKLYANIQNKVAPVPTNIPGLGTGINVTFTRNNKIFELSNHLGNVLATVSDVRKPVSTNGNTIDHYEANLTSAQDYYPFGMLMPGRNGHKIAGGWASGNSVVNGHSVPESLSIGSRSGNQPGQYAASKTINFTEGFNSGVNDRFDAIIADGSYDGGSAEGGGSDALNGYRYGFNGQEKSDEVEGGGSGYTAEFWEYDGRIGRRWNIDPRPTVGISDYSAFGNNPLLFSDPLGDTTIFFDKSDNIGVFLDIVSDQGPRRNIRISEADYSIYENVFHNKYTERNLTKLDYERTDKDQLLADVYVNGLIEYALGQEKKTGRDIIAFGTGTYQLDFDGHVSSSENMVGEKINLERNQPNGIQGYMYLREVMEDGGLVRVNEYPFTSGPWGNGPTPNNSYVANQFSWTKEEGMRMFNSNLGWKLHLPDFNGRTGLRMHPDVNKIGTKGCIGIRVNNYDVLFNLGKFLDSYINRCGTINVYFNIPGNPDYGNEGKADPKVKQ